MKHGIALMAALAALLAAMPLAAEAEAEEQHNPSRTAERGPRDLNPDLYYTTVEEPAMRPVTSFLRGLGSVVYNTVSSFAQGNENFPVVGSVEAFRGLRRGAIELTHGTYMGMAGSQPRGYRELGRVNRYIDEDIFLRHATDTLVAGGVYSFSGVDAAGSAFWATATLAAQAVTDQEPFHPERMEERRIQREREREQQAQRQRPAQNRYLAEDMRASTRNRQKDGNLLRTARQRD